MSYRVNRVMTMLKTILLKLPQAVMNIEIYYQ